MRDVFVKTLSGLAASRPEIMLLTADLGFGVLTDFAARFPRQFLNVGVAEQNMTSLAAGLAMEGHVVFTYSLGSFPTLRCLEQIRNDVCYHNANVKIVTVGGGMSYGAVGPTHHATEDLAILRSLPHMLVAAPGDNWEAGHATEAIAAHQGPAYLRLDKSSAPATAGPGDSFTLGRVRTVREGLDLTLAAAGGILGEALQAADLLHAHGFHSRVLSVHTLKPLDAGALVAAAVETGGIVTIEEHNLDGGLGSCIAEALLDRQTAPGFFVRVGLRSCFSSVVGSQAYLRKAYGLDAQSIVAAVLPHLRLSRIRRAAAYA